MNTTLTTNLRDTEDNTYLLDVEDGGLWTNKQEEAYKFKNRFNAFFWKIYFRIFYKINLVITSKVVFG